jgi:hypothetical protein
MDVCLLCLYVVLSCVGRGLCDGLITRPEESYRVSNCVSLRNLKWGGQGPIWAVAPLVGWILSYWFKSPRNYSFFPCFSAVLAEPCFSSDEGRPIAKTLPTQASTTQKDKDKHPCLEHDSNLRSQYPSGQDSRPRPRDHSDRPRIITYPKIIRNSCSMYILLSYLSGSPVIMAWRVQNFRMEETASRYGG